MLDKQKLLSTFEGYVKMINKRHCRLFDQQITNSEVNSLNSVYEHFQRTLNVIRDWFHTAYCACHLIRRLMLSICHHVQLKSIMGKAQLVVLSY